MGLEAFFLVFIGFVTGLLVCKIFSPNRKMDGRLVVGDDDYFVGITTPPDELKKKEKIILKVITK